LFSLFLSSSKQLKADNPIERQTNGETNVQAERKSDRQTDRQTYRQTDGLKDRQKDRQADRSKDRQTDRDPIHFSHIERGKYSFIFHQFLGSPTF
jgi:hypothetical protein